MSFNCAEIDKLNTQLARVTKKFLRACEQVQAMNKKLVNLCHVYGEMEEVCAPAAGQQQANDQRPFNYNMMLSGLVQQIESVRDIKQVYVVYARRKADEITSIQSKLYGEQMVQEAYRSQQQQQQQQPNSYMDHSELVVMNSSENMFDSDESTLDHHQANDQNEDDEDEQYYQQNSQHFINPIEALLDEDPMDDDDDDDTESSERLVQYDMMNQSELQFVDNPVF